MDEPGCGFFHEHNRFTLGQQGGFRMPEDVTEKQQLQKAPMLNSADVVVILTCWAGAAAVTRLSVNPVVEVIAIAAAYYLSKWVILKVEN